MPPPSPANDFRRLINTHELADVTFIVEDKEVFAHRAVLACRSECFRVMLLTGGMRESKSDAGSESKRLSSPIHMQDVSLSVFLLVLEFLYTDCCMNVTLETGIHLMIASKRFVLDRLKSLCEDVIRQDIDLENCIIILVASHRHHAGNLKEIAPEFMLDNLSNPVIQNGLSVRHFFLAHDCWHILAAVLLSLLVPDYLLGAEAGTRFTRGDITAHCCGRELDRATRA